MNQKIDFFNKNNTTKKATKKKLMGKKSGSKTAKKKTTSTDNPQKRRGRRIKKILDNEHEIEKIEKDMTESKDNNSAVILGLKINPSRLQKLKFRNAPKQNTSSTPETSESMEEMFHNDIPRDTTCHKCEENEKIIATLKSKLQKLENKDKCSKTNKIYENKLSFVLSSTGKKVTIKKTNIRCWWDSYPFDNLPCFLPELYHNGTYHVTGCFCSFNCALAYNLYHLKDSKIYFRKSLAYKLYRELHGLTADDKVNIKEAPPKEILADYGGDKSMTINTYRQNFIFLNKEYLVFIPPIKPINMIVEERNIDNNVLDGDNKYILKRSKPLNKKRSVISSMKATLDKDDE